MTTTLIISPGNAVKKYALYQHGACIAQWRFARTVDRYEVCTLYQGAQQVCEKISFTSYTASLRQVLDTALREKHIALLQDITVVAVQIVAPGTFFQKHSIIDTTYMQRLRSREATAPLYIPHTVRELEQLSQELPEATVIGVSDSAFHAAMPAVARTYGIAAEDTYQYDIHRFGYQGIACASVWRRVPTVLGHTPHRCIIAHVGTALSMTAVQHGKSIDTTMGFSPASGLIMGSRAGSIESGALLELMRVRNLSLFDAQSYVAVQSGLTGLVGEADFRHILDRVASGDTEAKTALDIVTYHFQTQLGAYAVALGGLDTIVLTGAAMERSSDMRSRFLASLEWFGIKLDNTINDTLGRQGGVISLPNSSVQVVVITSNEIAEMHHVAAGMIEPSTAVTTAST